MENQDKKTALVVGATGLVGSQLVELLLAESYYREVRVLTRKSLGINNKRLIEILFDFNDPDPAAVIGDDIYCCLGTTIKKAGSKSAFRKVDLEYPMEIARHAKANGASQFLIVTAMGADIGSSIFYNQVKGEVERKLSDMHFDTLHILRPSLLLGDREDKRVGEQIGTVFARILNPFLFGPLRKYRAIDSGKVAAAMYRYGRQHQKGIFVHMSDELMQDSAS
ncbi:NAD(P)H-binding protein [Dyadobacter tibetensis]|uniref:NAD(P)H-binding protein n=1 Tax=Dyadobacter tibetensis TaxID=1211851 RepID=UPI00046F267E|nr:NAD(P)H-binding protein [Dyadobacter tibetensis]